MPWLFRQNLRDERWQTMRTKPELPNPDSKQENEGFEAKIKGQARHKAPLMESSRKEGAVTGRAPINICTHAIYIEEV